MEPLSLLIPRIQKQDPCLVLCVGSPHVEQLVFSKSSLCIIYASARTASCGFDICEDLKHQIVAYFFPFLKWSQGVVLQKNQITNRVSEAFALLFGKTSTIMAWSSACDQNSV